MRAFGSIDPDKVRQPQLQFMLQGLYEFDVDDHKEGEQWEETFTCLRQPPAGVLDDLVAATGMTGQGEMTWDRLSLIRYLKGIVIPADENRLDALLRDKARPISLQDDLGPLLMYLSEKLMGRPTTPPSS